MGPRDEPEDDEGREGRMAKTILLRPAGLIILG